MTQVKASEKSYTETALLSRMESSSWKEIKKSAGRFLVAAALVCGFSSAAAGNVAHAAAPEAGNRSQYILVRGENGLQSQASLKDQKNKPEQREDKTSQKDRKEKTKSSKRNLPRNKNSSKKSRNSARNSKTARLPLLKERIGNKIQKRKCPGTSFFASSPLCPFAYFLPRIFIVLSCFCPILRPSRKGRSFS